MSELNGKLVTVFGGGGFVGRYVVQALCAAGARVRVAVRHTRTAEHVKPLGNLGQVSLCAADVTKPATVANALIGADMAVNLVGSFDNLDAIQRQGAANVAEAAAAAGLSALVHISAIGADANSAAEYGRSKAGGEAAVRAAFPAATILRPSIIFGREDQFINRFAGLIRMLPVVPVIGADTRFQPVFVGDVARAVVAALQGKGGETLELGGPETYSMLQLNEWIAKATGHNKLFVPVPDAAAKLLTFIPGGPISGDDLSLLERIRALPAEDKDRVGLIVDALEAAHNRPRGKDH